MTRSSLSQIAANNIAREMERRGLSMADLNKAAGLGHTGVNDIVNGKSGSPRLDTIEKIARALNMHPLQILQEEPEEEMRAEVLSALSSLPPDEIRRLLAIAKALQGNG